MKITSNEEALTSLLNYLDDEKVPKKELNKHYKKFAEFTGYDKKGLMEDGGWCYDVIKDVVEENTFEEIEALIQG